jgi:predicted oxidoreductase
MQPVIGTMNVDRLNECCRASEIYLTREEWYEIYRGAGNILP